MYELERMDTELDIEIIAANIQNRTRANIIQKYVQCRKRLNITQGELAKKAGMSRTNITRFESGTYNPSLEMMVKIALALGMKLDIEFENIDIEFENIDIEKNYK